MREIRKWHAPFSGTKLLVSKDAKVRLFGAQNGSLHVWIETEPGALDEEIEERTYIVVGTGHQIPPGFDHVGSTQDPPFVWHLYERRDPL